MMGKKKSKWGVITPRGLPSIRKAAVKSITAAIQDAMGERDADPASIARLNTHREMMRHAALWWVSESMTALAVQACQDIPVLRYQQYAPSPAGVITWQGGIGLTAPADSLPQHLWAGSAFGRPQPPQLDIRGVLWSDDAIQVILDEPRLPADAGWGFGFFQHVQAGTRLHDRLEALLVATWVLADDPHLGVRRFRRERTEIRGGKVQHESEINIVYLREPIHHQGPSEKEEKGTSDGWALNHRVMVRGHWKMQPYGPHREQRRPIYVMPYLRGPLDAPLLSKPTVHVWRR